VDLGQQLGIAQQCICSASGIAAPEGLGHWNCTWQVLDYKESRIRIARIDTRGRGGITKDLVQEDQASPVVEQVAGRSIWVKTVVSWTAPTLENHGLRRT